MEQKNHYYKPIRISAIKEEVKGFKTIIFEEGHGIQYKSGQYLTLLYNEAGEEIRRSYSIISSPVLDEPLSIGVKRVENGFFSRRLVDDAQPGDMLYTTGSGGLFTLPEGVDKIKRIILFAAGSGITPILSIIKTALHAHPHLSVVLIYSNASKEKAVYLSEILALQQQFSSRFQLELLFSNAADLSRARLHRDLILNLLEKYDSQRGQQIRYYVCGPESYMRLCIYTLQEQGVPPGNIKRENFVIHTALKRDAAPPDKETHVVQVKLQNSLYEVSVSYPDSILKAARKQGLVLPYSCEAGRCGNCVAKCTSGTVWHSYNEVLTERELQKGLILTCVGHPVGGDVNLEI